jgi:hypothetical protein
MLDLESRKRSRNSIPPLIANSEEGAKPSAIWRQVMFVCFENNPAWVVEIGGGGGHSDHALFEVMSDELILHTDGLTHTQLAKLGEAVNAPKSWTFGDVIDTIINPWSWSKNALGFQGEMNTPLGGLV